MVSYHHGRWPATCRKLLGGPIWGDDGRRCCPATGPQGASLISGAWTWVAWLPVTAAVAMVQIRAHTGLRHTLGVLFLTTYIFWMISAGFFPMPTDGQGFLSSAVNLVPITGLVRSFGHLSTGQLVRQHGGNLLLLVPFTLVGPALWPRVRAWKWAVAIGLGGSVAIELLQLAADAVVGAAYRSVDVDDVIVNTVGALLGYGLFLGVRRIVRARRLRASAPR